MQMSIRNLQKHIYAHTDKQTCSMSPYTFIHIELFVYVVDYLHVLIHSDSYSIAIV